MPAGRIQKIRKLTDSTGGTPSVTDTVVDTPASYVEATLANQLATITRKVNQIIDVLAHRPG